jgi:hypothetical protein
MTMIGNERWAPWVLDTQDYALVRMGEREVADYPVDLLTCVNSAEVLDWIFQIEGRWDGEVTPAFIRAIDDILHPQANLCSMGQPKTLTPKAIKQLVAEADAKYRR